MSECNLSEGSVAIASEGAVATASDGATAGARTSKAALEAPARAGSPQLPLQLAGSVPPSGWTVPTKNCDNFPAPAAQLVGGPIAGCRALKTRLIMGLVKGNIQCEGAVQLEVALVVHPREDFAQARELLDELGRGATKGNCPLAGWKLKGAIVVPRKHGEPPTQAPSSRHLDQWAGA